MERLKITLVGLVLVLALVVAYGYGCGDSGDDSGDGGDSVATEADSTAGDGTGASTDGEGGDSSEATDSTESTDGGNSTEGGDSSSGDSDSGSTSSSGKPLTKAAYIEQGDLICQGVPQKYGELVQELEQEAKKQKKPKPNTAEINLAAAVPPLPEAAKELEELVPPKGDEAEAEAIVAALEAAAKGLEEKPNSELSGPKSPFDEFQKLTGKYGFRACSQL
ncbi:MAG TPA: hypothetical protein VFB52_08365 [Solirubrobacterales bacterium]|nr:hypothetical protein [Solirubrobacterales bacterium]